MTQDGVLDVTRPPRFLLFKRIVAIALPILVIVLGIVGFVAMKALKPEPEKSEDEIKAIPVLTQTAYTDDVTLKVTAQGEAQARTQINIVPQVAGKITYMSPQFIEGGRFSKGDLLIRIEPTEYDLRVVQAQANVAQAETALAREKSESDIARRDWEELNSGKAPSALTLREPQMAEAAAQLASAQARLKEAELQLRRTSIRAPFDGRVIARDVDRGEFVTTGRQLGQVYATDVIDVRLPMTNQDLARIGLRLGYMAGQNEPGIPVKLSATVAGRYATWDAEIVRTDSRFDPRTRVLHAYAEVRDPFGDESADSTPLVPGLFVDAEIAGNSLSGMVIIPRDGLRGKDKVYVAQSDGTLSIKTVTVASSDREKAVIAVGLPAGSAVITSPIRGVADGMQIDVVDRSGSDTSTDAAEE